ncbi:hypothetical protein Clacol_002282 [Clathrus columnatus]|uniref:Uncharacterized protein n=1 Tax=Clathrus columnatus TaxID=1419009 RepID=A0AAV5A4Z2_9AGAM|nr:hypothetical protein Clacol_002282 [Clathrus columnatus]
MDFFTYLGGLNTPWRTKYRALNDFVVFLLGMLDYDAGSRIIHTQTELSLCALDSKVDVTADVAILKRTEGISEYVLLVMEEVYIHRHPEGAEGRLMADAVAAFCQNNLTRKQAGFPCLDSQTILGIVMTYTQPTFYKILVNQAFVHQLLEEDKFPAEPIYVRGEVESTCQVLSRHREVDGGIGG